MRGRRWTTRETLLARAMRFLGNASAHWAIYVFISLLGIGGAGAREEETPLGRNPDKNVRPPQRLSARASIRRKGALVSAPPSPGSAAAASNSSVNPAQSPMRCVGVASPPRWALGAGPPPAASCSGPKGAKGFLEMAAAALLKGAKAAGAERSRARSPPNLSSLPAIGRPSLTAPAEHTSRRGLSVYQRSTLQHDINSMT